MYLSTSKWDSCMTRGLCSKSRLKRSSVLNGWIDTLIIAISSKIATMPRWENPGLNRPISASLRKQESIRITPTLLLGQLSIGTRNMVFLNLRKRRLNTSISLKSIPCAAAVTVRGSSIPITARWFSHTSTTYVRVQWDSLNPIWNNTRWGPRVSRRLGQRRSLRVSLAWLARNKRSFRMITPKRCSLLTLQLNKRRFLRPLNRLLASRKLKHREHRDRPLSVIPSSRCLQRLTLSTKIREPRCSITSMRTTF